MPMENLIQPQTIDYIKFGLQCCVGLAIPGIFFLALTAPMRRQAYKQAGYKCQDTSGESHLGILEASHRNHRRDDPNYNKPESTTVLCSRHHLVAHLENEGTNGLNQSQNSWAIKAIATRIAQFWTEHQGE